MDQVLAHLAIEIAELRGRLADVSAERDKFAAEVVKLTPSSQPVGNVADT